MLNGIRKQPGHEGFLLPPDWKELRSLDPGGPVVLLTASRFRCDALVLHRGETESVALGCTRDELLHHVDAFNDRATRRERGVRRFRNELARLWGAVVGPVLTGLGHTEPVPDASARTPRIWWCTPVIGTLRPVYSGLARLIAKEFYEGISSLVAHDDAARVLHAAVSAVRPADRPWPETAWTPFIHFGP